MTFTNIETIDISDTELDEMAEDYSNGCHGEGEFYTFLMYWNPMYIPFEEKIKLEIAKRIILLRSAK